MLAALATLLGLTACGGQPRAAGPDAAQATAAGGAGNSSPPVADRAQSTASGVSLSGSAPPGSRVRLATPAGQETFTLADRSGRWTIVLPPSGELRIFGLSAAAGAQRAQAEGYVLVAPKGQAALLRAGAGAIRLDPPTHPGLRVVDFDRAGYAVVTAAAPPGATVIVNLDGRQVAEGRTDATGRYEAALQSQLTAGPHRLQAFGDGVNQTLAFQASAPQPLAKGPLRSQLTGVGLRVDWMTPGGGVQSTLLVD